VIRVRDPGKEEERDWTYRQENKMELDMVSHFFDNYRQKGQEGQETLQLIREDLSKSFKESSLGDCKL